MAPAVEFLFPRRIARLSYWLRSVVVLRVAELIACRIDDGGPTSDVIFIVALVAYWGLWVLRPRYRDLAMPAWSVLLVLVPGLNLFLLGYPAWGRTKVRADWLSPGLPWNKDHPPSLAPNPSTSASLPDKSDATLRQLEALRNEGTLTEDQFLRMKSRHGL
ncbi:MAG: hypothetical protein Q8N18_09725 [Opitutaceae bacterium]|nr:hypothetical protein [Opitutaceae bacterium]